MEACHEQSRLRTFGKPEIAIFFAASVAGRRQLLKRIAIKQLAMAMCGKCVRVRHHGSSFLINFYGMLRISNNDSQRRCA
jgi:hypothetical protein